MSARILVTDSDTQDICHLFFLPAGKGHTVIESLFSSEGKQPIQYTNPDITVTSDTRAGDREIGLVAGTENIGKPVDMEPFYQPDTGEFPIIRGMI